MAQPVPDPFAWRPLLRRSEDWTSKIPNGRDVLILLGVLFLLTLWLDGIWAGIVFWGARFLIFLGGWLFARNGEPLRRLCRCQCALAEHDGSWDGVLLTVGVLFQLQNMDLAGLHFHRTGQSFCWSLARSNAGESASTEGQWASMTPPRVRRGPDSSRAAGSPTPPTTNQ